jgi:hypothetical protein
MNNTGLIDRYLNGKLSIEDKLRFEYSLQEIPAIRSELALQKKTMRIIKLFFRKNAKAELEKASSSFFQTPEGIRLKAKVKSIF